MKDLYETKLTMPAGSTTPTPLHWTTAPLRCWTSVTEPEDYFFLLLAVITSGPKTGCCREVFTG